jgi:hypothetical protein
MNLLLYCHIQLHGLITKKKDKMSQIIYRKILPVVAGALLGYAYYYYIGCNSGTCAITSSPYISTIYGGVIGLLLVFPSKKKKKEKLNDDN